MYKVIQSSFMITSAVAILILSGCQGTKQGKFSTEEMQLLQYPTKTALPKATGGYTINVGDDSLSTKEIIASNPDFFTRSASTAADYKQFRADAKPAVEAIVTSKIADLLLYQHARKSMPESFTDEMLEKAVEDEVRRFIATHNGNYSQAEKAIREMGMDWDTFRDYQKRLMIVQSFLASETGEIEPVTYDDILNYYNAQKEKRFTSQPSFQFRLIDINIDDIELPSHTDPNTPPITAEQAAEKLANEIMEKLNNGGDFAQLAKQYSHGYAADDGGLWEPATKGSLAKPYDTIEQQIQNMTKYEIAGPMRSGEHFFIIQLEYKTDGGIVPFTKVQQRLASELEFMRRKRMVDEMMYKFSKQVDLDDKSDFVESCLIQAYNKYNQG